MISPISPTEIKINTDGTIKYESSPQNLTQNLQSESRDVLPKIKKHRISVTSNSFSIAETPPSQNLHQLLLINQRQEMLPDSPVSSSDRTPSLSPASTLSDNTGLFPDTGSSAAQRWYEIDTPSSEDYIERLITLTPSSDQARSIDCPPPIPAEKKWGEIEIEFLKSHIDLLKELTQAQQLQSFDQAKIQSIQQAINLLEEDYLTKCKLQKPLYYELLGLSVDVKDWNLVEQQFARKILWAQSRLRVDKNNFLLTNNDSPNKKNSDLTYHYIVNLCIAFLKMYQSVKPDVYPILSIPSEEKNLAIIRDSFIKKFNFSKEISEIVIKYKKYIESPFENTFNLINDYQAGIRNAIEKICESKSNPNFMSEFFNFLKENKGTST